MVDPRRVQAVDGRAVLDGSDIGTIERFGLSLLGVMDVLMAQSIALVASQDPLPEVPASGADLRLVLVRREVRLMASLMRRHLARLPEPPEWMRDLLRSLDDSDEMLRWTDGQS